MRLPGNISVSTYLAYKQDAKLESERKIKSENFEWDSNHPKSLSSICVEKLNENWIGSYCCKVL